MRTAVTGGKSRTTRQWRPLGLRTRPQVTCAPEGGVAAIVVILRRLLLIRAMRRCRQGPHHGINNCRAMRSNVGGSAVPNPLRIAPGRARGRAILRRPIWRDMRDCVVPRAIHQFATRNTRRHPKELARRAAWSVPPRRSEDHRGRRSCPLPYAHVGICALTQVNSAAVAMDDHLVVQGHSRRIDKGLALGRS